MKRALVLSGGGAKGCWQAGAITRLIELGRRYDAYFGVSVGAINAAHMAQFPTGMEAEAIRELKEKWHSFSNNDIWKHHNPVLKWLLVPWKQSVYDTSPLREYLKEHLDPSRVLASGKKLGLGAVDMTTGQYVIRDETYPYLREAVYDSAAYPVMFEMGQTPPDQDGHYMYDGGLVHVTPLKGAIIWGADIIDVITLDPEGADPWKPPERKWWEPKFHDPALRVLDVIIQNIIERDLKTCIKVNQRVVEGRGDPGQREVALNIYRPDKKIPVSSLDFDPETMAKGFQLGYEFISSKVG